VHWQAGLRLAAGRMRETANHHEIGITKSNRFEFAYLVYFAINHFVLEVVWMPVY